MGFVDEGQSIEFIDQVLLKDAPRDTLSRYVNVALLWIQEGAEDRPTILDALSTLSNRAAPLLIPKQPTFSYLRNTVLNRPKSCSVNNVSVLRTRYSLFFF